MLGQREAVSIRIQRYGSRKNFKGLNGTKFYVELAFSFIHAWVSSRRRGFLLQSKNAIHRLCDGCKLSLVVTVLIKYLVQGPETQKRTNQLQRIGWFSGPVQTMSILSNQRFQYTLVCAWMVGPIKKVMGHERIWSE